MKAKENEPRIIEIETTIEDLAEKWDYYFFNDEYWVNGYTSIKHGYGKPLGFSVGKGKKLYHLITVSPMGFYYGYPMDDNGTLGWRRQIEPNTKIVVKFPEKNDD